MVDKLFTTHAERSVALKVFFSVYMLERRTSLGQGVPFSIQDSYVDLALFTAARSVDDYGESQVQQAHSNFDSTLAHLLAWTKLAGQTWQAVNTQVEKGAEFDQDALSYLDFQTVQWYNRLPMHLKINTQHFRGQQAFHIRYTNAVLFTRKSHLRNLIYRPVLQTASRMSQFDHLADIAISVAQEALDFLKDMFEKTTFVKSEPIFFKHLWLTALGNLLLAVVNSSFRVWDRVRGDLDAALNIIKTLSDQSVTLMRLWQRLQGLQQLHTRLSQNARVEQGNQEPHAQSEHPNTFPSQVPTAIPHTIADQPLHSADFGTVPEPFLSPSMREQLNEFFSAPDGLASIFEFPFSDWGNHTQQ